MSIAAMTWAFQQKLPPTQKLILLALADFANDSGSCWPGVRTVAEKAGVSRATLFRHLDSLEQLRLIQREERTRDNGSTTSNTYFLIMRPLSQIETPPVSTVRPPEPSLEYNNNRRRPLTDIPDDFAPTPETVAYCAKNRPDVNLEVFTLEFIESCGAKGYQYRDWQRAFKAWVLKEGNPKNVTKFRKPQRPTTDEIRDAVGKAYAISEALGSRDLFGT